MTKVADDLKRIVGIDKILELLLENGKNNTVNPVSRGALEGARGVAFNSPIGVLSTATSAVGATRPTNTDADKKDPDASKTVEDGEKSVGDAATDSASRTVEVGNDGLTSDDNSLRDGWYDIESAIQGAKDAFGKSPPMPGSNLQINTLTGLNDSNDITRLVVHTTGAARQANNSYIASRDRESANEKVAPQYYAYGWYWYGPLSTQSYNIQENIRAWIDSYDVSVPAYAPFSFDQWLSPPQPGTGATATLQLKTAAEPSFHPSMAIGEANCSSVPPDFPNTCPLIAPAGAWGAIGAVQLAFATTRDATVAPFTATMSGKFVMHPYASDRLSEYEGGVSIIDGVTHADNLIRIGPLGSGGYYIHYRNEDGTPTGGENTPPIVKINPNLTHGGYISPNQLLHLLPR